jgi:hypothetical protein
MMCGKTISALSLLACVLPAQSPGLGLLNHGKPIVHAHNCYPYDGRWMDGFGSAFPSLA